MAGVQRRRRYSLDEKLAALAEDINYNATRGLDNRQISPVLQALSETVPEFPAIPGGTSVFGGRRNPWAPEIGTVLFIFIQGGLAMTDANTYAYPVITGGVILIAAVLESIPSRMQARTVYYPIR